MVNFSALFLSLRRLSEVIPPSELPYVRPAHCITDFKAGPEERLGVIVALDKGLLDWLNRSRLPTLGCLIAEDKIAPGAFFTHFGTFYGKGVIDAASRFAEGKPIKAEARIRAKLDAFRAGCTLDVQVHPENYTTFSSAGELSGQKRLFVVGRITEDAMPGLRAQAYAIGHFHEEFRPHDNQPDPFWRLQGQMEVFATEIDNFRLANEVLGPGEDQLDCLKQIPESKVKATFAKLVDEPFVPKDWGGEQSDLLTSSVRIVGKRYVTAFAFKGPAKFKPLTVADLGKNGDQIARLFGEPADLVILQHCHAVTAAVRHHMRAFATRIGQLRPFCIIDGADTVRIFKAYRELGF